MLIMKGKNIKVKFGPSFKFYSFIYKINSFSLALKNIEGCPCGVMVKVMDYGIVVSEFVLKSH